MAALVAANILREACHVVTPSPSGPMDRAMEPIDEDRVRAIISAHEDGDLEVYDLKTRIAGPALFIEFHMVVSEAITVDAAHDIRRRTEGR